MKPEVVLFDLGGVLIELGGIADLASFAQEWSEDELWRRWLECPWVRRFERGQCGADEFATGMVDSWSMTVEPDVFLKAFAGWPLGLLPGAHELVHSIKPAARVCCLSNTNTVHAERQWAEFGLEGFFEERFFSHEMGLVKPDREAFDHVIKALGCPAEKILFLDDNQINVDGARAAGLRAERTRGTTEARAVLSHAGL